MIRIVGTLFLLLASLSTATAAPIGECLPCHREKTPAAVRLWEASAHARAHIGCEKCHGTDHEKMLKGEAVVDMKVCGPCHKRAYEDHRASRHGIALHTGWGCTRNLPERDQRECRFCHEEGSLLAPIGVQCARFLKQSKEMGENGCNSCHRVESSCASCHSSHATDLKIVRDPASCAKCHMGPDHPQWEMWQTSQHGTLYGSLGVQSAPSCQTCHMAGGSHNVSVGITMNPGSVPFSPQKSAPERAAMLKICGQCHASGLVLREFANDDAILRQSLAIVKEADKIIWDLFDQRLLDPMPDQRPPHPLSGYTLVTDSQFLYEDTSHIERLFFKMKKYDLAKTVKGAYHQNPAYTHWLGNAELKMDLVDIKAEASRLKDRTARAAARQGEESPASQQEQQLRNLKNKQERGALPPAEYEREKKRIMDELLGKGKP